MFTNEICSSFPWPSPSLLLLRRLLIILLLLTSFACSRVRLWGRMSVWGPPLERSLGIWSASLSTLRARRRRRRTGASPYSSSRDSSKCSLCELSLSGESVRDKKVIWERNHFRVRHKPSFTYSSEDAPLKFDICWAWASKLMKQIITRRSSRVTAIWLKVSRLGQKDLSRCVQRSRSVKQDQLK